MSESGLELAAAYYADVVGPLLQKRWPGLPHAAARLGGGSEVLGLDDELSRDHDWGLRLTVLVDADRVRPVHEYLEQVLPEQFAGRPVRFAVTGDPVARHRVAVETVAGFARARLGLDPDQSWTVTDWLSLSGQAVLEVIAGKVFLDTGGELATLRQRLAWYPEQVWRYVVAVDWARIGEELPLLGRAGDRGDELGWRVILSRLTQAAMHLGFMLDRCWPPYAKWVGTRFVSLPTASAATSALRSGLAADHWLAGQESFCQALAVLHELQRQVGLPTALEPLERFHTRPYLTVHHHVTALLIGSITDPDLRALPMGLGCVEQRTDNVTILTTPHLRKATLALTSPG